MTSVIGHSTFSFADFTLVFAVLQLAFDEHVGACNTSLTGYLAHYYTERNDQGKRNLLLFPARLTHLLPASRFSANDVSAVC